MAWDANTPYNALPDLPPAGVELETKEVLKATISAREELARLVQASELLPNPSVLIHAIPLLEAQASSEIENIVTTTDELFKHIDIGGGDHATKEALRYRTALFAGLELIKSRPLTTVTAIQICTALQGREMSVRTGTGTRIANPGTGDVIYSPPEGVELLKGKLAAWESFIHGRDDLDPLVRMAIAHYQFEAIHPFTDGNGRTGRVINILLLIELGLLKEPILYLSRAIISRKNDYYRLLREVTESGAWIDWIMYMLEAVRDSASSTFRKIRAIKACEEDLAARAREVTSGGRDGRFINLLFEQPYCRISSVVQACGVSRQTAASWLQALVDARVLVDTKIGRERLFVNHVFLAVLTRAD